VTISASLSAPICPDHGSFLAAPALRSQDIRIKYMFIVQRCVYRATVRPDAGRCWRVLHRELTGLGVSDPERLP